MSVFSTLTVHTGKPYDILVGRGLLAQAGSLCRAVNGGQRALIVTDTNVQPLYAAAVAASLRQAGYTAHEFVFPAGEQSKRLDTVRMVYAALAEHQLARADLLVALGGGVTGDMTGFAAATWMRGMDFVQIPTTLLAQVDSSVGGKTGVDIDEGKNLVGAFWQPARVITDIDTLSTLPSEVFADGLAEVIKTAAIKDADLFAALESGEALTPDGLPAAIARCIDIKRGVVERDEREQGERKLLNFGHTLGHALEQYYDYTGLSHGCAVAVGMAVFTKASEVRGLTAPGTAERLITLLEKNGLPVSDPAPLDQLLPAMARDKKRAGSHVDLILLKAIGNAVIHRAAVEDLPALLDN